MKTALVLGAGGFIGSHLVRRLKEEGYWVRGVDLKYPEFWETVADDFVIGDLRDRKVVSQVMFAPGQRHLDMGGFDEVYQLAADMGGAGYLFIGIHDADIMHNSVQINLNVLKEASSKGVRRIFYASSACFVKGTKVFTDRGYLNIEDIDTTMSVIAEDGEWHRVLETTKKTHHGQLCKLHVLGCDDIICTPDHRFLTSEGEWVRADQMKGKTIHEVQPNLEGEFEINLEGDKYVEMYKELNTWKEPLYKLAEKYGTSLSVPYDWKRGKKYPIKIDPVTKSTAYKTYDLGWLVGIWLSEGWIEGKSSQERLVCAFGKHELELVERYVSILSSTFGIDESRIISYESRTGIKIQVSSKRLIKTADKLCDLRNKSHNKKLTMFGIKGSDDYRQGILDGSNDGDGSKQIVNHGYYERSLYSTSSIFLARQYGMILNSLGIYNSTNVRSSKEYNIEGRKGTARPLYTVYTKLQPTVVQSVELIENNTTFVYNLEVEDVHSYIVEGCTVHNCVYPEYNQMDPDNPKCTEDSTYPAEPESEYGWEKLFSERMYQTFARCEGLDVRIGRFHGIFGPYGTWAGGKEKAPAALCRKVAQVEDGGEIEVWGDGEQTRSFLYIDEAIEAVRRFMLNDGWQGPVNIGSDELVSINQFVDMVAKISGKVINKKHITGPLGVRGRNSDNNLIYKELRWRPSEPLIKGIKKTYDWIEDQVESLTIV